MLYFEKIKKRLWEKRNLGQLVNFELTRKEREVLFFICQGHKYKIIGHKLGVKEYTISKHASNILKKTKCKNRKALENLFNEEKSN